MDKRDVSIINSDNFYENPNLLEANVIIFDTNDIVSENYYKNEGKLILEQMYDEFKVLLEQRTIIIFLMPRYKGGIEFIQTFIGYCDNNVEISLKSGKNLRFVSSFKYLEDDALEYYSVIKNKIGKPICFAGKTDIVLGTEFESGNSKIILLPYTEDLDLGDIESFFMYQYEFQTSEFELPDWCKSVAIPNELKMINDLKLVDAQISEFVIERDRIKNELTDYEKYKILFAGMGKPLERQVKITLQNLGFTVESPDGNRVDHILKYKGKVAVLEVKGIERKSAAEAHAAQLEKWVSEYKCEHPDEKTPKGILVANSFSTISLNNRKEPPFPNQMLKYCTQREQCLISGIQLFCLSQYLEKKPNEKDILLDRLFNTVGVFEGFENWSEYIESLNVE